MSKGDWRRRWVFIGRWWSQCIGASIFLRHIGRASKHFSPSSPSWFQSVINKRWRLTRFTRSFMGTFFSLSLSLLLLFLGFFVWLFLSLSFSPWPILHLGNPFNVSPQHSRRKREREKKRSLVVFISPAAPRSLYCYQPSLLFCIAFSSCVHKNL